MGEMAETDDPRAVTEVADVASPVARGGRQAATIYDIAELAGVNPSTVSRALTKPGRISEKTEKRIRDAARALNYRVNPMARALPTGRTGTIGLILADVTNPVFFDVLRGAERVASEHDYTLVIAESQESGQREAAAADRVIPSVDALILVATRLADEQIRELAERKPLVVINREVAGVDAVVPDLEPGIDQALEHLINRGHRSLAYLSGPRNSWMSSARWELVLARAVQSGMTVVEIGPGEPTLAGGRALFERVLASGVSAVLAYNDLMAIGLMRAAEEHDIAVPGRLSIIGFDNIFGSDFTSPPLTTIRSPLGLLGAIAVDTALEKIPGIGGTGTARTSGPEIATELLVRGSTGPRIG